MNVIFYNYKEKLIKIWKISNWKTSDYIYIIQNNNLNNWLYLIK